MIFSGISGAAVSNVEVSDDLLILLTTELALEELLLEDLITLATEELDDLGTIAGAEEALLDVLVKVGLALGATLEELEVAVKVGRGVAPKVAAAAP